MALLGKRTGSMTGRTYSLEVTHVGHVLHRGSIEDQIGNACRLGVLLVVFDEDLKQKERKM